MQLGRTRCNYCGYCIWMVVTAFGFSATLDQTIAVKSDCVSCYAMSTEFSYRFAPPLPNAYFSVLMSVSLGNTPNLTAEDSWIAHIASADVKTRKRRLSMLQACRSPFPPFPFRLRLRSQVSPYHSSPPSLLPSTSSTSRQFNKFSIFEDCFSLHTMDAMWPVTGSTTLEFVFSPVSSSS